MQATEMAQSWVKQVQAEQRRLALMERHALAAVRAVAATLPEAAASIVEQAAPKRRRRRAGPAGVRGATTALMVRLLEGEGGAATAARIVAVARAQGVMGQTTMKNIRNRITSCLRHGVGKRWQHDVESHQYRLFTPPPA